MFVVSLLLFVGGGGVVGVGCGVVVVVESAPVVPVVWCGGWVACLVESSMSSAFFGVPAVWVGGLGGWGVTCCWGSERSGRIPAGCCPCVLVWVCGGLVGCGVVSWAWRGGAALVGGVVACGFVV